MIYICQVSAITAKTAKANKAKMKNFYHEGHEGTQREIGTYLNCTLFFQKVSVKKPFKIKNFYHKLPRASGFLRKKGPRRTRRYTKGIRNPLSYPSWLIFFHNKPNKEGNFCQLKGRQHGNRLNLLCNCSVQGSPVWQPYTRTQRHTNRRPA
jgi:hypothetical protein